MIPTSSGADAPLRRDSLDSPRDARVLAEITSHLQGALPLQEVLHQISRGLVEGLEVLRADVFLLDEQGRELVASDLSYPVTDEKDLLSATVIRGQSAVLENFGPSAAGLRINDRLRMRLRPGAIAAVPLIAWGKVMGLILLNDAGSGQRLAASLPLLEAIAQQAGLAIERARLYEDRERAIRELTNLQEATALLQGSQPLDEILQRILNGVTEALDVDRAILFLHDRARGVLRGAQAAIRSSGAPELLQDKVRGIEIPVDDPAEVMAATVLERRPCIVSAAGGGPESRVYPALGEILHMGSFVTAPLLAKDKVMGVLTVDNFQREVPFKDRLHLLMAYGAQAGMAVERTLLEEQLKNSERRYREFIENSPDAIIESTTDGRVVGCNGRAVDLLGYSRGELLSMEAAQIWADPPQRQALITELGRRGHVEGFHVRVRRKDGTIAHVEVSSRLSTVGDEPVLESIVRDVTQRYEIERKMRMLSDAVTYSADAFISLDHEGRIKSWNKGAETIFGYTSAEMLDRPYQALVPPERMDEFCEVIKKAADRDGQLQGFETVRLHKSGRRIPVSISVSVVRREDGEEPGYSAVVRDITERKIEERRRHLLSSITEQSPDAILSLDPDGLITSWNRGAEKMFGYGAGEIVGQPWLVLASPGSESDFRAVTDGKSGAGSNGSRTVDTVAKSRTGSQLPVSLSASELHDEQNVRMGWSVILRDLTEQKTLAEMSERLQEELYSRNRLEGIVGNSRDMEEVRDRIRRVARFNSSVLLVGPSGTGKEIVANAIHYNSPRRDKPLIKVNCAAIPEDLLESELLGIERNVATGVDGRIGRFEMADGGTLFLDEIGDMSLATQAKILRVLQEREFERVGGKKIIKVDLRIIAATNKDLETEIRARRFREDLYYRLNVIVITLPPLAQRREDIDPLIDHFLQKFALENNLPRKTLSLKARLLLNQYEWPGNVRELEHAIERAVVMGENPEITEKDLPPSILIWRDLGGGRPQDGDSPGDGLAGILRRVERRAVLQALERCGWVQARAARMLGISERSMWYRVKKLGLKPGAR